MVQQNIRLEKVLPVDPNCRGVIRLSVGANRQVARLTNDPCETLRKNRFTLSNGETCFGWPTIVTDRTSFREIVSGESPRIEAKLREVAKSGLAATLFGQTDPARCSPEMLWFSDAR